MYSRDRALASETRFQTHSQFQHSEFSWRRRWNRQRQRQWNFFTFPPVFPVLSWATGLAEFRKNWYKEGLKWTRIITTWRKFFKTHDRFDCQGDLRTRRGGPEDPEGGPEGRRSCIAFYCSYLFDGFVCDNFVAPISSPSVCDHSENWTGPQGRQTVRYNSSPTELSWLTHWRMLLAYFS